MWEIQSETVVDIMNQKPIYKIYKVRTENSFVQIL